MNRLLRPPKHQVLALMLTGVFFLLAAVYSVVTPLFESPDEVWHYPFIWHLTRTWELPVQEPARPQLWQQEGSQPPLYYWLAALLTMPLGTDDLPDLIYRNPHADIGVVRPDGNANIIVHTAREQWPWHGAALAVHLVRLFSALLGTGTVLATYGLGRTLWPERPTFALVAMAFVAFNPMFIFISASVNNDNLITFLAALTVLWLVRIVVSPGHPAGLRDSIEEPPVWPYVGLGAVVGLAALSKVSGLGLVGLAGLTLLIWGWRRGSWRMALGGNIVIGLVAATLAGWWYGRNISLYSDWSGTANMVAIMGARSISPTPGQFLAELSGLVRSFWGLFGYFSVPLPGFIYATLNFIFVAGLLGLLIALRPTNRRLHLPRYWPQTWPILLGWLVVLLAGFIQWTLRTPASQGRLLFPGLSVLAILWAAGWLAIAPRRWSSLPGLVMLAIAIWTPWGVIAPAYRHPARLEGLPAAAQPLAVTFGRSIRLLGYGPTPTTVHPGDNLPLTLYWQGTESIAADYTLFIHLLDGHDLVVAQRNVFHGPGVHPTGQWQPGQIFGDRYVLQLPHTAYTPSQTRFEVGLYDHTTGLRLPASTGGDSVRFGDIAVRSRQSDGLPNPQRLLFEDNILLVGYDLDRRQVAAGEMITLTLFWQAQAVPDNNYQVFVHMVGPDEQRVAQHDSGPQNGSAPTSSWSRGEIIVDPHPLAIAPDARPDAYHLVVGLYDGETGRRLRLLQDDEASVQLDSVTLGGIRVDAAGK